MNYLLISIELYYMFKKLNKMVFKFFLNFCGIKECFFLDKKFF